jgi:hypothetical protein
VNRRPNTYNIMPHLPRLVLAASAVALLAQLAPAGVTATAVADGGLSVTPAVIERTAVRGDTASIMVVNSTGKTLKITVTPRPWTQSRSGAVAPNRTRTLLARVGVSARSFTLTPGARRSVAMNVKSLPAAGSLYGSVETIGIPPGPARRNGITAAYRLISTLRLNPPSARRHLAVRAAAPRVRGTAIVLPVKNTGNTVSPISGDVRFRGASGTHSGTIAARPILPGATVDLALGSTRGIPKGSYTVTVALRQDGRSVGRVTRRLRVK